MIKAQKSRPLTFFCLSFVFFLCIALHIRDSQKLITGICALITAVLFLILGIARKSRFFSALIALIPITLGIATSNLFCYRYSETILNQSKIIIDQSAHVKCVVEEVLYENDFSSAYKVKITELDGKRSNVSALLKFPFAYQADEYDKLTFDATFSDLNKEADSGFNEFEYCISNGMTVVCNGKDNVKEIEKTQTLITGISQLSRSLSAKLRLSLGEYNGGFLSGLLLGRRSEVPDKLSTSFDYLGISHILSVSGLHLSIIIGALYLILSYTPLPMWIRFIICMAATVFFVLLTGGSPAIIRSGIMMLMTFLAYLLGRDYDPLTALSLSAFIIVIIDPLAVFSASFVLSFSATLGIIALGIPACSEISKAVYEKSGAIRALGSIGMSVAITLAATIFTLPAVYYFFRTVSAVSVFTNLIFVPLSTVLMFAGIILLITYGTFLFPILSTVTSALSNLVDKLSYSLSQALPELLALNFRFVFFLLIALCALFVLLKSLKIKGTVSILILTLFFVGGYTVGLFKNERADTGLTEVVCFNRADNDYILLNKNGNTMLCDMSNGGYSTIYELDRISMDVFHDTCPDVILLTHLHRTHITMLSRFTDNHRPNRIILPYPQDNNEISYTDAIKRIAREKDIAIEYYSSDSDATVDFEDCKITIFEKQMIDRSNQPINMISFKDGATFTYCGGAINETDLVDELKALMIGEAYIWLGTHGPVEKEPFEFELLPHEIFVSNDSLNDIYETDFEVLKGYKHITLKRR